MSENSGVLREVSWRDLCPWFLIFRTFRISVGFPVLLLALGGTLLTPVGWLVSEQIFVSKEMSEESGFNSVLEQNRRCPCDQPGEPARVLPTDFPMDSMHVQHSIALLPNLWYQRFVQPFAVLFDVRLTLGKFGYFLFGGLWTLAVWSFFGGAITRIAAMQLGREERVSLKDAVSHACRKWVAFMSAPILPMLGVAGLGLPIALLGLFMMGDWGVLVAGIFWIFALLAGFIMAVMLLGLAFGWPLMWGTISTEGTDAFDALSRSYAYTFQRPMHYLFYTLVAAVFGLLCWTLVYYFSEAVIDLTFWAGSWGSNLNRYWGQESLDVSRMEAIRQAVNGGDRTTGVWLVYACVGLVRAMATAFTYSFFWCVATAIYLLLRRDVDQTEIDEVWADDETERYELPPIRPDKDGVPDVADQSDAEDSADSAPGSSSSSGEASSASDTEASPSDIPPEQQGDDTDNGDATDKQDG